MGVFDKIKNALFEVEYVEVDEKPKKEKRPKSKDKRDKVIEDKPIAKKVVLPGKKEDKVEKLEEEELKDDNFEIRPKDETLKEISNKSFQYMDDSDFTVDDEPRIVEVFDHDENLSSRVENKKTRDRELEHKKHNDDISDAVSTSYRVPERESKPYGLDDSYKVSMHEYGTYEKKDEKAYFKPSPIISPIYGILDKNYKKEDVVSKKDIRITTNYSRSNVNVDDIRNKAFGRRNRASEEAYEDTTFEVEEEEENVLVDLSDEKEKPEVKEVTVGDAMEYFQDLGLEYNVDYVDATKDKNVKTKKVEKNEKPKEKSESNKDDDKKKSSVQEKAAKEESEAESKSETTKIEDDDNLFDLIDSMYKEES